MTSLSASTLAEYVALVETTCDSDYWLFRGQREDWSLLPKLVRLVPRENHLADEQDMVPLHREIKLCKQYLALEQLRMGDRLSVAWQIQEMPDDALIPALLLQPLLENAVYHGIEPLIEGGCIHVLLRRNGGALQVVVDNPRPQQSDARLHAGNKIALQNIRERLDLLFDVEASYQVASGKDYYRVEITLPYMKEQAT